MRRKQTRGGVVVLAMGMIALLLACNSAVPKAVVKDAPPSTEVRYPARPSVAAPAFQVFHQDNNTYTLVTSPTASDDEVAAILWELRDAAHAQTFAALHLSQAFIDSRKPKVWFHVYRGRKCAGEKFVAGALPCGNSYHGAGDYTLGSYKDAAYEDAVLHRAGGGDVQLWNPEAKRP